MSILLTGVVAVVATLAIALALGAAPGARGPASVVVLGIAVLGQLYGPDAELFTGAMVVLTGAGVGALIGGFLATASSLASFSVAAAIVDVYSVLRGPTRALVEGAGQRPELMDWLVIQLPTAERGVGVIGVGDLLVAAAMTTALRGLGIGTGAAVGAPTIALTIAMIAGLALGPLPGLPFLAAATLLLLWRHRTGGGTAR